MKRVLCNERGSITALCLIIIAIVLVLVTALASETVTRVGATRRSISREQARCIAEAGLEYATYRLKTDSTYVGTNGNAAYAHGTFNVVVQTNESMRVITSVGTAADGVQVTLQGEVSCAGSMTFPDGCMIAQGDVVATGSFVTATVPGIDHQASISANGDVTGNGSIFIDGGMSAHGTVDLNGSAFIRNSPVKSGAPLISFPDAAATNAWQQKLISKAQAGGTIDEISLSGSKNRIISAPVYIDGDIKLTGSCKLTIVGSGAVYVNGSIKTSGSSAITSSALLAAADTIDVSGSNSYTLTSSTPDHVGLVSFATDKSTSQPAIVMTGSSSMGMNGLVYAARGGIKLTGSAVFYGALLAGGGSIKASGSAIVYYPINLMKNNDVIPGGFEVQSWIEP